jgi:Holliday junction DNA helicase RuvA
VREDVLSLYGFETENERDFYLSLLKVSGVGPKLALDILEMQLGKLKKAIKEKNSALLSQIKGLGKKTAEKIILELSSKIDDLEIVQVSNSSEVSSDVISLLENLGFNQKQIFHKLADLPGEYQDSEAIVRWFLKEQNK